MKRCCLLAFVMLMLLCVPRLLLAAPVVFFDEGHGQPFLIADEGPYGLASLAGLFRANGYDVRSVRGALDGEALATGDVLVISGAFQELSAAEVAAVRAFVARGGSLAVMLHVAPPLRGLLHALEVDFANGTLREHGGPPDVDPRNFRVNLLASHPLMEGLTDVAVYGAWALRGTVPGVDAVASTGRHAWIDLNRDGRLGPGDAVQSFAVAVAGGLGGGRFVVFGDDAIFQNSFLEGSNLRLAENLVRWLKPAAR